MDEELIERVAKAIYREQERQANVATGEKYIDWLFGLTADAKGEDADSFGAAEDVRALARAAIEAMTIPIIDIADIDRAG